MKKYLSETYGAVKSLLVGMGITLRQFFKPVITEQYPHTAPDLPQRYRGHIELARDPETGQSLCMACKACERGCPSDCIVVDGVKREGEKRKSVTQFLLDYNKCSLCGACVEVCSTKALQFSRAYNLASGDKNDFQMDLVARFLKKNPPAPAEAPTPESRPEEKKPEPQA